MTVTSDSLGFHEIGLLAEARAKVLEAINSANLVEYRAAWGQYQDLAEAQINVMPSARRWRAIKAIPTKVHIARKVVKQAGLVHIYTAWKRYREIVKALPKDNPFAKAQIGLIFAKADIRRSSHDRVRYWEELHDAATYAHNMGYLEISELPSVALHRAATSHSFLAEFLQATRRYDDAIDEYMEREQDECLTDRERGLVNLRLAECYQELLDQADSDDAVNLKDLLGASIESALEYLKHEPEQVQALRLQEEFENSY